MFLMCHEISLLFVITDKLEFKLPDVQVSDAQSSLVHIHI